MSIVLQNFQPDEFNKTLTYIRKKNPTKTVKFYDGDNAVKTLNFDPIRKKIEMDYIAVVDPVTFEEVTEIRKDVLIVGAIHVGSTRLIDNCFVDKTSKY